MRTVTPCRSVFSLLASVYFCSIVGRYIVLENQTTREVQVFLSIFMKKINVKLHFATILFISLIGINVHATVMVPLDEAALIAQSDVILRAKVLRQHVVVLEQRYWTETRIQPISVVHGALSPNKSIRIRQPGGTRGEVSMRVAGSAQFSLGEEVFLFLRRVDGIYMPVGMAQGKYHIYRDSSGTSRVSRDVRGIAFAVKDSSGSFRVTPSVEAVGTQDRALDEFLASITARIKASKRVKEER